MVIPSISIWKVSIYDISIILAILLGGIYLITRKEYTVRQKIVVSITTIISGLVGARLYYAIVNFSTVTINEIFALDFAYFKGIGALIAAFINIYILTRFYKVSMERSMEILIQWFFIGGAISKIGCFFTGCCKGEITHVPWAIYRENEFFPVHPAQLYDCAAFIFSFLILFIMKKKKVKGHIRLPISLMTYLTLRGIVEKFYYNGRLFGGYITRIMYVIVMLICVIVMVKKDLKNDSITE